jgi:methionyl-tRNA formyltransferase
MVAAKVPHVTSGGGIVFMGSSGLGARCCEGLLELGLPVAKILSIPREFTISWSQGPVVNAQFADLSELAAARSIPFAYVRSGRADDYRTALGALTPDLFVVAGWYYLIPNDIRTSARLGAVGVHASLLPRYRGGAPLVWAIINGEREAGVTLFHLSSGVDDGDIVAQAPLEIEETDDIRSVIDKATQRSAALVREYVPRLLDGTAPRTPQVERSATVMPQRSPADGLIEWGVLTSTQAYDWIRAQTSPYPGAYTFLDGARITIWAARPTKGSRPARPPGTLEVEDGLAVWCAEGTTLEILAASLDDGGRITAKDLIARVPIRSGARLAAQPVAR